MSPQKVNNIPKELKNSASRLVYIETCRMLMDSDTMNQINRQYAKMHAISVDLAISALVAIKKGEDYDIEVDDKTNKTSLSAYHAKYALHLKTSFDLGKQLAIKAASKPAKNKSALEVFMKKASEVG